MRTRLGLGAGLAIGMGVGVALAVSFDNWILGISIGVIIGLSLSAAIGRGSWRRRDAPTEDAGGADSDGIADPDEATDDRTDPSGPAPR